MNLESGSTNNGSGDQRDHVRLESVCSFDRRTDSTLSGLVSSDSPAKVEQR